MTQTFHVVGTTFGMGCMVTNVTVHTWRQGKMTKKTSLSSSAKGPLCLGKISKYFQDDRTLQRPHQITKAFVDRRCVATWAGITFSSLVTVMIQIKPAYCYFHKRLNVYLLWMTDWVLSAFVSFLCWSIDGRIHYKWVVGVKLIITIKDMRHIFDLNSSLPKR